METRMKTNNLRNDDYLIEHIDKAVGELVVPNYKFLKFYNYYNGRRDAELFRYLEENFGIGLPTSVEFTPLIRKHIDAIIGEYLDTPLLPKVSCKDKETISKITRDKELEINKLVFLFLRNMLNNLILSFLDGKLTVDLAILTLIDKLVLDIDDSFISNYEIAALDVIEYILLSRHTDLTNKLKYLLLDLLVTGCAYYKVGPSPSGTNIEIETLNPLNVFVERNPESVYVKDCYRIVVRRWMTRQLILTKYGDKMDLESLDELESMYDGYKESAYMYVRSFENCATLAPLTDGIEAGKEVVPGFPLEYYNIYNYKLLPVYEVEWLDTDKENNKYITNRYTGVRINSSIYVLNGKSKDVIRSHDNPEYCGLSVNGLFFTNRSGLPYSLVGACMFLLDKYDILNFLRDNVIANSGTAGDWLDLAVLPSSLGTEMAERILKWYAYKKSGIGILDSSLDGNGLSSNTIYSGFDDALKLDTVLAFDLAMLRTEETCSSITGVFRERLNGINPKDAVTNIEAGTRNSYIITKQYNLLMDTLSVDILLDSLNTAKIVWKKGKLGTIILGDKYLKVFTSLPEYFTMTDYDIHIISSSLIMKEILTILLIVMEFIKTGGLDADIVIEAMTAKSLTDLKSKVSKAFKIRKLENDLITLAGQLLQLALQLIKLLEELNNLLSNKLELLNEAKIQIERERLDMEKDLKWYDLQTSRMAEESKSKNDNKRTEIEYSQLFDNNPYNDKVKLV